MKSLQQKLKITQAVIVEGKCDKNVLESVIDATIIPVNGFGVYKDKAKLAMIRRYAETNGVILLTDSDNAGRQIRNYLKDYLRGCQVEHIYVPNLYEVEDTSTSILREAFANVGAGSPSQGLSCRPQDAPGTPLNTITRERLFDDGFIGRENSAQRRKELLNKLCLPENLSVTALLDVLNKFGLEEYERFIK